MRIRSWRRHLASVVTAALLLGMSALGANAQTEQPPAPMSVYGNVVNSTGAPLAQGTVQAFLNGQPDGSIAIAADGTFGGASTMDTHLEVQGTAQDKSSEAVTFQVNNVAAGSNPQLNWQPGAVNDVTLTVTLPTVTSLSPDSGTAGGGTAVTITGIGFMSGSTVDFGTNPATNVTVTNDTTITATSPAGSGTVDVTVTTAAGTSGKNSSDRFTYTTPAAVPTVSGLNPDSGPAGTAVTITGTGFTSGATVDFGTNPATNVTVTNDTTISATSPAGSGTVDVTVTTAAGTSSTTAGDRFTYTTPAAVPTVTSLSPDSGPAGTVVTITGTGFTSGATVDFGTKPATNVTVTNDTTILATSPAGSGTVDVTVTTAAGTSSKTADDQFTYTASNNTGGGGGGATSVLPAPSLTAGTVTSSSVVINLTDTGSVVSFNLYENGSSVNTISASGDQAQYTVTGLTAATTYVFTATAKDANGNVSGTSAALSVTTSPPPVPVKAALTFSDVPQGFWAHDDIYYMADQGYVHGMGNGLFEPNASVTRAQFVTIVTNMLGLSGQGSVAFTDVSPSAWYYQSVVAAYKAGLIKGLSPTTFGPDLPITREQMAAVLANMLTYKGVSVQVYDHQKVLSVFEDAGTIDRWAEGAAAVSVQEGLIHGLPAPDGGLFFEPLGSTTRAQATVMLRRLLSVL